jgi:hypothetical protein
MKKLIQLIFAGLFAGLLVAGCALETTEPPLGPHAAPGEPVGTLEQAQSGPCYIELITNAPTYRDGNDLVFTLTHRNAGTVGCTYKFSVDVFTSPFTPPGNFWSASPVYNGTFLQPGQSAPRVARVPNVFAPCFYRVFQKYKPNYPSGSETWFVAPNAPNDVFWC